ncbi:MAG: thioredoxin family protein [candidate division KSB1 bacterium]|nr:thioredoxin family protein [candidate division KSB1 bacterium]
MSITKSIHLLYIALLLFPALLVAGVQTGEQAPDFDLIDVKGETHSLSQYDGKLVVLEWFNYGCPFVQKHYKSDNMQNLQEKYTEKGVVWLTVTSSAPGKPGFLTAEKAQELEILDNADPTAILLDHDGSVGNQYGAKTTPHMFIINKEGKVVYNGAIDSIRSTDPADVSKAKNYASQALDELLSGKDVSVNSTKPYGCSVKY